MPCGGTIAAHLPAGTLPLGRRSHRLPLPREWLPLPQDPSPLRARAVYIHSPHPVLSQYRLLRAAPLCSPGLSSGTRIPLPLPHHSCRWRANPLPATQLPWLPKPGSS